ncbi:hypothetical protein B0J13DRAFT_655022 [Dactylonectria estremocensis]|uniref:Xylanolytic transcriptional activator regulatory domain-containing protein n=1 Tax=Dactylonectria estremocensis TaxID=1079267 RepID=A0A9P9F6Y4_9HYPO|nr:hypothetical protein B0J13DRAFT_655022 [Dactylonectria estremocensis]
MTNTIATAAHKTGWLLIPEHMLVPEIPASNNTNVLPPPTSSVAGPSTEDARLSGPCTKMQVPPAANATAASQRRSSFRGMKRELNADDDNNSKESHRPRRKTPASTASSHSVDAQASEFIQVELNQSKDLLRNRRTILEAALDFVTRVSDRSNDTSTAEDTPGVGYPSPLPPFAPETLVLLIKEMTGRLKGSNKLQFPDHILPKTLEKMGAALVDGSVSGQTLVEYQVCVHFKTYTLFTLWPPLEDGDPLKKHIKASKDRYRGLMSQALNNISLMAQPTFSLCQALGVFAHLTSDASRSWNLIAFASRALITLGYHKPENAARSPQTDEDYEIHGCVYWCFLMDRLLSMHLGRSPSLPDLEVNRAWLSHPNFPPFLVSVADLFGDFACIQNTVLAWRASNPRTRTQDGIAANMSISAIQQRLGRISTKINKLRQTLPSQGAAARDIIFFVEFPFYSLDTAILRLSPYVGSDPETHQRCLASARNALLALSALQERELRNGDPAADVEYPRFIAWTIHAYPLCPFFVVFCHVVSTSSSDDFQLIHKVAKGFARYASGNKAVARLHDLFSKLVELCRPLFEWHGNPPSSLPAPATQIPSQPQRFDGATNPIANKSFTAVCNTPVEHAAVPQQQYALSTYVTSPRVVPRTGTFGPEFSISVSSLWTEDTMMGLFNYEPSLGWLNGA